MNREKAMSEREEGARRRGTGVGKGSSFSESLRKNRRENTDSEQIDVKLKAVLDSETK